MHHIKPIITAQNDKQRSGKGFSPSELKEAGLTKIDARKMRIPVDWRRKTSHNENVASLKSHAKKPSTKQKSGTSSSKEKKPKS
jgi:ribosomal protein L13E